ncbi:hypothetical protein KUTeg_019465 [Tegillarca granosa]|uniref:Uncharacterized protein n=1 Tax=Tegillarca granosa TaxID=220873 RepID=A0ABQ9ECM5_TEGGR|nr:hypothetical protein KUTeg_019465 [Tegillarca granosa]
MNIHTDNVKEVEDEIEREQFMRRVQRAPSPLTIDNHMQMLSVNPRTRSRSSSMKKPKPKNHDVFELEDMRPRTSSLPAKNNYKKPYLNSLRVNAAISGGDSESDLYRLRTFVTTPKGIVNRGDSLRSKSTSSVLSSGSEMGALSRTSSTQSSIGNSIGSHGNVNTLKVLVLGAESVGKTALIQQFMTSEYLGGFDTSIDGDDTKTISVLLDGEESMLEFIDFPNFNLCSASSHIIEAFVVVFSIDDRQSFDVAVDLLYKLRKEENKDESIVLVANKCDLVRSRVISFEEAKSVARTYNCKIIETSSVLNHNVDDLLAGILSQIRLKSKDKSKNAHDQSCLFKGKNLLTKLFKRDTLSKSCDKLYVL